MHLNILTTQQRELLPLIRRFRRSFYLAGGTASALHIGHRRSIDFDLFVILRDHYSILEISAAAAALYGGQFSEKLFREQLSYHADIDYTETVEYISQPIPDSEIRTGLINLATGIL